MPGELRQEDRKVQGQRGLPKTLLQQREKKREGRGEGRLAMESPTGALARVTSGQNGRDKGNRTISVSWVLFCPQAGHQAERKLLFALPGLAKALAGLKEQSK